MNMIIERLDEAIVCRRKKNFIGHEDIVEEVKRIANIMFRDTINSEQECYSDEIMDFFSVNGNILLHGKPGNGKTSIAYIIADYLLDFGIETYTMPVEKIITSNLGKTVENIKKAFKEMEDLSTSGGILVLIDEVDRYCINRMDNNDSSELKRLLIEFMDFMDNLTFDSKIMIIATTNVIETIDGALLRRFCIQEYIDTNSEILKIFVKKSNKLLKINMDDSMIEEIVNKQKFSCCNDVKMFYRRKILQNNTVSLKNLLEG